MLDDSLIGKPVILIVDDQTSNIRVLREAIHDLGDVYFAVDGESAISLARTCLPDVVLLDIEMPGMDGFAVCQALKSDPQLKQAAVIFVTAHSSGQEELQALDYGGVDFLSKPLNVSIARARIRTHLALRLETRKLELAQHDLRDVLHHLPAFVGYWQANLRCAFSNEQSSSWFGIDAANMVGKLLPEVLGADGYQQISPQLERVLTGKLVSLDLTLQRNHLPRRDGQLTLVARIIDTVCVGFLMLLVDITERKRYEEALFEEKERIRVMLNSIGDAVIATNPQGQVIFMNPIAESLTGWQASHATGKSIEQVMPLRDGSNEFELQNPIRLALQENRVVGMALNCKLLRRDGSLFDVEDSASPISNQQGQITGAIVVFHDVSEARAMAIKMTHLAYHDALTNLPNRMLLQDRIMQAIQQAMRNQRRAAMMVLDLDNFKSINDAVGHAVGDTLLQQVANRLQSACRTVDTISRQGGDEFILLLPEIGTLDQVGDIAVRLLDLVAEPVLMGNERYDLSACIGISLFPDDSEDSETLYRHADSAMYKAKQSGRGQFRFFSVDIEHNMRSRHLLEQHMRAALESSIFEIHYQPKVDAKLQSIVGAEALIRWRKEDGSLISPVEFIPLAEETGLIIPIGKYVLKQACHDAMHWHALGFPISVSVNISAVQFRDPQFLQMVLDTLGSTGIRHDLLELEITEGVLAQDINNAQQILQALRELGVRISIDDFGTGYSSLSYLKRLPLDVLKIDQSFVRDMLHDKSDAAIVEAIIKLGTTLGLELVAEGVENHGQVNALLAAGCRIMQGYLYSRPITTAELEQRLQHDQPASQN
ncbi:EAL domain-containing protein [Vogesella sp. LIG4]|uniref:two-component system response regulator n=1 Tax=Vogesella sp. LIG4 TaxID=1192162 RepID=UPI00081FCF21|nr:EAL domain-containing protein [Vogesella sp. LIG4]SCK24291.1 response regulator receiver modulated diguanylate cyclase/phosphodiesterase with PAS/PAC sensor(s) [Vogesella sp. LIG4]